MGQESRHAFTGDLVLGSRKAVVWVLAEVAVSSEGLMGGSTPKFTDGFLGSSLQAVGLNSQVLKSCWPEVSLVPCHVGLSALKHAGFIRVSKGQHR